MYFAAEGFALDYGPTVIAAAAGVAASQDLHPDVLFFPRTLTGKKKCNFRNRIPDFFFHSEMLFDL